MRKITLQKISITNFKGISALSIDTNGGGSIDIYGANASGKTTVVDAITWLLFGKDSLGSSDFEIKSLNKDGEPAHNLNHTVSAVFQVDDRDICLEKTYKEKWTKKRGSSTQEFSGHTTDLAIDGVPMKQSEYQAAIAVMFGDDKVFRILSSPTAFAGLHWIEQRKMLLAACGDISADEIIASDPSLCKLPDILQKRTADEYKKVLAARRQEINKRLAEIPPRIDELDKTKPELASTNPQFLIDILTDLRGKLSAKQQQIAAIRAGGEAASLNSKIMSARASLQALEIKHKKQLADSLEATDSLIADAKKKLDAVSAEEVNLGRRMSLLSTELSTYVEALNKLGDEWKARSSDVFSGDDKCPSCGQSLPPEKISEAKAFFLRDRSAKLQLISDKGTATKQKVIALQKEQEDLTTRYTSTSIAVVDSSAIVDELIAGRNSIISSAPAVNELPEYQQLNDEIAELQARLTACGSEANESPEVIQATQEADQLQEKINCAAADLAKIEQCQAVDLRIGELKTEERNLSQEYATTEGNLAMIEGFTRAMVAKLDERINGRFSLVRFKLFDEQINGGISDTCIITVGGVPYGSLNNAARVQAGCDVIRTLSEYFQVCPMLMVDNRESVSEIPPMDAQVINLYVSPSDTSLRIQQ